MSDFCLFWICCLEGFSDRFAAKIISVAILSRSNHKMTGLLCICVWMSLMYTGVWEHLIKKKVWNNLKCLRRCAFQCIKRLKMWFCEEQKSLKSDKNQNSHIPVYTTARWLRRKSKVCCKPDRETWNLNLCERREWNKTLLHHKSKSTNSSVSVSCYSLKPVVTECNHFRLEGICKCTAMSYIFIGNDKIGEIL